MGNKNSGNPNARGKKGNRGGHGGGRPETPKMKKLTVHVRMSPELWDLINIATVEDGFTDWREAVKTWVNERKRCERK